MVRSIGRWLKPQSLRSRQCRALRRHVHTTSFEQVPLTVVLVEAVFFGAEQRA